MENGLIETNLRTYLYAFNPIIVLTPLSTQETDPLAKGEIYHLIKPDDPHHGNLNQAKNRMSIVDDNKVTSVTNGEQLVSALDQTGNSHCYAIEVNKDENLLNILCKNFYFTRLFFG